MVIETETTIDAGLADFEAHVARTVPDDLRREDPPGQWRGSRDAWAELLAMARDDFRRQSVGPFVRDLIQQDREDQAQRALASIPLALANECRNVLDEARRLQAPVEQLTSALLETAATYQRGSESTVANALKAAQASVAGHKAKLDTQRREAAARPILRVLRRFRGPGGKTFEVGEHQITPAQAEELRMWETVTKAMHAGRDLASVGFPVWPVLEIVWPAP